METEKQEYKKTENICSFSPKQKCNMKQHATAEVGELYTVLLYLFCRSHGNKFMNV